MKRHRGVTWLVVCSFGVSLFITPPSEVRAQIGGDDDVGGIVLHKVGGTDGSSESSGGSGGGVMVGLVAVPSRRSSGSRPAGSAYTWSLGFVPVGEMLVFNERATSRFAAETEYHHFAPQLRHWLERSNLEHMPLRFEKRRMPLFPSARSQGAAGFQRSNARSFHLASRPLQLVADPGIGRYLFHLASAEVGAPGGWIDHYLVMEFTSDDPSPALHWYVDAQSVQRLRAQMGEEWRTDERWAVRPLDDGLLTPIDEAVGYEMVPRPVGLDRVDGAPGRSRQAPSMKGR